MKMCKRMFFAAGIMSCSMVCSSALADVVEIDGFEAEFSESFEDVSGGYKSSAWGVFDGSGSVGRTGQSGGLIVTSSWSYKSRTYPHTGGQFMGSPGGAVEFAFDKGIHAFGGYFTTNSDFADGVARFYDASDDLIAEMDISAPTGSTWEWNGWQSDESIFRVVIDGNHGSGGFVMMDDLSIMTASVPAPGALAGLAAMLAAPSRRRRR